MKMANDNHQADWSHVNNMLLFVCTIHSTTWPQTDDPPAVACSITTLIAICEPIYHVSHALRVFLTDTPGTTLHTPNRYPWTWCLLHSRPPQLLCHVCHNIELWWFPLDLTLQVACCPIAPDINQEGLFTAEDDTPYHDFWHSEKWWSSRLNYHLPLNRGALE